MPKWHGYVGTAILLYFCSIGTQSTLFAHPNFLVEWSKLYPESESSKRVCQLCHFSDSGGEPWNAYGFDIREEYIRIGRLDIALAISGVESHDSDNDPKSLSNLVEIKQDFDPGWLKDDHNAVFFRDCSSALLPTPISNVDEVKKDDTALCVNLISKNKTAISTICL